MPTSALLGPPIESDEEDAAQVSTTEIQLQQSICICMLCKISLTFLFANQRRSLSHRMKERMITRFTSPAMKVSNRQLFDVDGTYS